MLRRLMRLLGAAALVTLAMLALCATTASADPLDWMSPTASAEAENPAYAGATAVAEQNLPAGTVVSQKEIVVDGLGPVVAKQLQVVDQTGEVSVVTVLQRPDASKEMNLVHLPPTDRLMPTHQPSYTLAHGEGLAGEEKKRLMSELDTGAVITIPDAYGRFGQYAAEQNGQRAAIAARAAIFASNTQNQPTYVVGFSGGARDALLMIRDGGDQIIPNLEGVWASSPAINGPMLVSYSNGTVSSAVVFLRAAVGALDGVQQSDPELAQRVSDELHPSARLAAVKLNELMAANPSLENWFQYMGLFGFKPESFTKNNKPIGPDNPALQELVDRLTVGAVPTDARIYVSCSAEDRYLDCQQAKDIVAQYQALGVDATFVDTPALAPPAHVEADLGTQLATLTGDESFRDLNTPATPVDPNMLAISRAMWAGVMNVVPQISAVITPLLQGVFTLADYIVAPQEMLGALPPATNPVAQETSDQVAAPPAPAPVTPDPAAQVQEVWQNQVVNPTLQAVETFANGGQTPADATPPNTDRIEAAADLATTVAPQHAAEIAAVEGIVAHSPYARQVDDFLGTLPIPGMPPAPVPNP